MGSPDRSFWENQFTGLDMHLEPPSTSNLLEGEDTIFTWKEKSTFASFKIKSDDGRNQVVEDLLYTEFVRVDLNPYIKAMEDSNPPITKSEDDSRILLTVRSVVPKEPLRDYPTWRGILIARQAGSSPHDYNSVMGNLVIRTNRLLVARGLFTFPPYPEKQLEL